jgi:hypothetical protein
MGFVADNRNMILSLILVAAFVGVGLLAVRFGVDSRVSDPRDMRSSWR